ncbi:hypothetical protein BD560DRAFT_451049 [Blakeslea trispora]|nr:hypothetical protein BD560DRAFT_451049 [Blakeslea trispora]
MQCLQSSSLSVHDPVYIPAITQPLQFTAFRHCLRLALDNNALSNSSTLAHAFRQMIVSTTLLSALSRLIRTRPAWNLFWRLSLGAVQRNAMSRLMHRLIPTRQILHRLSPDKRPSAFCLLCSDTEDIYHFFFVALESSYTEAISYGHFYGLAQQSTTLGFCGVRGQSSCLLLANVLFIVAISEPSFAPPKLSSSASMMSLF